MTLQTALTTPAAPVPVPSASAGAAPAEPAVDPPTVPAPTAPEVMPDFDSLFTNDEGTTGGAAEAAAPKRPSFLHAAIEAAEERKAARAAALAAAAASGATGPRFETSAFIAKRDGQQPSTAGVAVAAPAPVAAAVSIPAAAPCRHSERELDEARAAYRRAHTAALEAARGRAVGQT